MRFLCLLHSSATGEGVAQRLRKRFADLYGRTTLSRKFQSSSVDVVSTMLARNSGAITRADSVIVVPYLFHTTDGAVQNLAARGTIDAVERFAAGKMTAAHLAPFVTISVSDNRIEVAQDFIGSGRCYVFDDGELAIATNSLACVQGEMGKSLDWQAMASFANCGWVRSGRTFDSRFRMLDPNERVVLSREKDRVQSTSTGARPVSPDLYSGIRLADLADTMTGIAKSIAGSTEHQISLGLSGGRDSRLMTALFLAVNADLRINTFDDYAEETAIVVNLINSAGFDGPHTIKRRIASNSADEGTLVDRARSTVWARDGLHEPAYLDLQSSAHAERFLGPRRVMISGAGGELAHGHYYPSRVGQSVASADRGFYVSYLFKRILYLSIANAGATEEFKRQVYADLDGAPELRDPIKILDYFYLYERLRRWSEVSARPNIVAPMVNPMYAFAAFGMDTDNVRRNFIPRTLTESIMPPWRGVPYFKATGNVASFRPSLSDTDVADVLQYVLSFDDLGDVLDLRELAGLRQSGYVKPAVRDGKLKRALSIAATREAFGA